MLHGLATPGLQLNQYDLKVNLQAFHMTVMLNILFILVLLTLYIIYLKFLSRVKGPIF